MPGGAAKRPTSRRPHRASTPGRHQSAASTPRAAPRPHALPVSTQPTSPTFVHPWDTLCMPTIDEPMWYEVRGGRIDFSPRALFFHSLSDDDDT